MDGNISLNHSEWCILEALWQKQPKTLMQLVREMKDRQGWSKSTTNTMLRRMQEKAYIRYEEGEKARLYHTDLKREEVVLKETESFLKRTYGGSLGMLVNMFVENNQLTDRDIAQLREILHRAEEKKRSSSEQS
ncbi:MAG: BlaI/MecI/CopY family transcriptional regulator [Lachnospiraceae bacterium]|nr:BlaI/MecI/CopY family transcriptional regulator [Lachnospiraceae bacterium]GFI04213.1 penicillinase repressor [Lachnospiraceae bacterium]